MLIVDEAHELVSRVTGVATGELTPAQVNRAVRRAAKLVNEKAADQLQTAAEGFERLMELALPGRLEEIPDRIRLSDITTARDPHKLYEQLRDEWGPVAPMDLEPGVPAWLCRRP